MAQNIFSGDATQFLPYVDQTDQGQPPVKKKLPANGTQTSGFGPSQIGGGAMGENQARPAPQFAPPAAITMPSAQESGSYQSPAISHSSEGQNQGSVQSPIPGFGGGYSHPMSDLHGESQARWQSHGIDFDSLLKQGIANSASGSSISRDLFQREKAAELNQRYIDAAASQMHPQQIGRTQDIDLLKTLGITLESMPKVTAGPVDAHGKPTMVANPEYLSLQQNYHQLLSKLGLDQAQGQVHTAAPAGASPQGQTGTGQAGGGAPQPNAANPNVQGFGGGVKSFLRGMAPTGGATAGWMGASKVAGMIPGLWGTAAKVALPLIGAAIGSKATTSAADMMMPDAQDAEAAHPWARMAGEATGFAPGVAQYMKNRSAAQQPQQQEPVQPVGNPVMEAQVNPTPTPQPQPAPVAQPTQTGYGGFGTYLPKPKGKKPAASNP